MNRWFIAIKKRDADPNKLFDLEGATYLDAPAGHYWADPFVVPDPSTGKDLLFFEDYDYTKGVLAVGELDGIEIKNVRTVLEQEWHLSFPSVVQIDGAWYMVPEQCLSGQLVIYKALEFPDTWTPIKLVASGRFDDPLLRKIEEGYEITATEGGDNLRVFHAKEIDGEWRKVFSDSVPFARNAGHTMGYLSVHQDSVPTYGRAIVFKSGYGDKVVHTIEPTWYPGLTGTHTFNVSDKYVVWDGRIKLNDSQVDKTQ